MAFHALPCRYQGAEIAASVAVNRGSPPYLVMKKDYVFIVNPNGANGQTRKEWEKLLPKLNAQPGKDWNISEEFTRGPLHAVDIARKAIKDGAAAVIAVGGDGTLHEVVNGFFENGQLVQANAKNGGLRTALGLIPLGTGSDFARGFGWTKDPLETLNRLTQGKRKPIDVGCVKIPQNGVHRYFVNEADLHLSAKDGYIAAKYKKWGNLCYVIGALQAFSNHQNQDLDIRTDGGDWRRLSQVTSIVIGNSKYFGGGIKIAPKADPSSGDLEVISLQGFKWYDFLMHLPKLYKGTHLSLRSVSCERVHNIEIRPVNSKSTNQDIYVQADGEHLGFLPATVSIIPGAIDMLV